MDFPMPNAIDIGAAIVILLCVLRGVRRGLSGELPQMLSTILALGSGLFFQDDFGFWLEAHARVSGANAYALAFTLTVVGVLLVLILLGLFIGKIGKVVFEKGVDKPGGGVAGFISGSLYVVIILMIMNLWPHDYLNRHFGQQSVLGNLVVKYMPGVKDRIQRLPLGLDKAKPATEDVHQGVKALPEIKDTVEDKADEASGFLKDSALKVQEPAGEAKAPAASALDKEPDRDLPAKPEPPRQKKSSSKKSAHVESGKPPARQLKPTDEL